MKTKQIEKKLLKAFETRRRIHLEKRKREEIQKIIKSIFKEINSQDENSQHFTDATGIRERINPGIYSTEEAPKEVITGKVVFQRNKSKDCVCCEGNHIFSQRVNWDKDKKVHVAFEDDYLRGIIHKFIRDKEDKKVQITLECQEDTFNAPKEEKIQFIKNDMVSLMEVAKKCEEDTEEAQKDIKTARRCMNSQLIRCDNKDCLNESCPLNEIYTQNTRNATPKSELYFPNTDIQRELNRPNQIKGEEDEL